MKSFRTDVSVEASSWRIDHKTPILTIGSCFSDAIGKRLQLNKFDILVNPFGAIFNPLSIDRLLTLSLDNTPAPSTSYVSNNGIHSNYLFHSKFSKTSRNELSSELTTQIHKVHRSLKLCNYLIVTYGTAFVHQRVDNGEVVANCHKVGASNFRKRLLTIEEIVQSFGVTVANLRKLNPSLRIVLTVSPVRHTKDTLELNNVSKSILRVACHSLSSMHDEIEYFPAFEIMTDELRDYRFYKADMIHPTEIAEDYIFEKFSERYFTAEMRSFITEWDKILKALEHKPFHPSSEGHQQFLKDLLKKLDRFTDIDTVAERQSVINQLI